MNTKLQISGLTFSYEERNILNEMDFRVKEGEFVVRQAVVNQRF